MVFYIRKYFWVTYLVTILLCALFAARGVARIVEVQIPAPSSKGTLSSQGVPTVVVGPMQRDLQTILNRNIFCSTCPRENEQAVDPSAQGKETGEPSNNDPVRTSLNLKLLATLVSDNQNWSFAAILDPASNNSRLFGIGSKVPGDAIITDIVDKRVFLLNGTRNEYLDLDSGANPPPVATSEGPSPEGSQPGLEDIAKGIRKTGEGKYEIDRNSLNKVLGNTTLLARSARIVPSTLNGQPNGFKLYAIRPGCVYSLLGLSNGDTINAINGHPMNTPDKALEIYTKLRNASNVSISFTRGGKPVNNEYIIR